MHYTAEMIKTLLSAVGFVESLNSLSSLTSHRYYYSNQVVTEDILWRDLWDYVCSQEGKVQNRWVIFFMETEPSHYAAVLVHFSNINPQAISDWQSWFNEASQTSNFAMTSSAKQILSSFYKCVQCWFLKDVKDRPGVGRWKENLKGVYSQASRQIQVTYINPEQDPGIVFTEYLLRISNEKPIKDFDNPLIVLEHHALCFGLLKDWLQKIQQTQPNIFTEITSLAFRLLKYEALQMERTKYEHGMPKADYHQLNGLLSYDHMRKRRIYQEEALDIFSAIQKLSFSTIVELLAYRKPENTTGLVQLLQAQCQKQQEQVKEWEKKIIQIAASRRWLWRDYIINPLIEQVYQYSLIGVGAELLPFFVKGGLQCAGVKLKPRQWRSVLAPVKDLGIGIGAGCTYLLGGYVLAKSIVIGNVSYYLHNKLHQIDDQTATVKNHWKFIEKFLPNISGLSQIFQVGAAIGESFWERSPYPLVQAGGGVLGSMGSVVAGKKYLLDDEGNLVEGIMANDAEKVLLSCALGGYSVGSLFFGLTYNGMSKFVMRKALSKDFCSYVKQSGYDDCVVDFSKIPVWSPSFWMQRKTDSVRLGCYDVSKQVSLEADCDIFPVDYRVYDVSCSNLNYRKTISG